MTSAIAIRGMLRADALRLRRDRFLLAVTVYLLAISVAMRWLLPMITAGVASEWDFDLKPYHALLVSYFIVQLAPILPGIVGGFLLLESREEGTVKALLVSPSPLSSYLSVACVMMLVTAASLTIIQGAIIGLALPAWPALIVAGLAGAPSAPMFALAVATLANNKVEAFAYMKFLGLGPLLATCAYFLPEPGQWLAALYPPYCASKAYWVAESGGNYWLLWALAGIFSATLWVSVLSRLFLNAARK